MGKGVGDIVNDAVNPFGAAAGAVAGPAVGAAINPAGAVGASKVDSMVGASGGKNSAPAPPDFNAAATNQAASSQQAVNQQTQANRPDQTNAFGSSSNWTQMPNGQWSQQTSLGGPLAQGAQGLEQQIGSQGPLGTGDQARDQAITGAYNQATSRLDPQWSQAGESQQAQLANQGLDPGSQAYDNAMGNFNRSKNDAYSSAMNGAIGQGTAAQQATFGENLAAQNNPYNQLSALSGLTGQSPVAQAGQAQAAQFLPAAMAQYGGAQNQFGAQQAGKNSAMGGASQLAPLLAGGGGGAAGALSGAASAGVLI